MGWFGARRCRGSKDSLHTWFGQLMESPTKKSKWRYRHRAGHKVESCTQLIIHFRIEDCTAETAKYTMGAEKFGRIGSAWSLGFIQSGPRWSLNMRGSTNAIRWHSAKKFFPRGSCPRHKHRMPAGQMGGPEKKGDLILGALQQGSYYLGCYIRVPIFGNHQMVWGLFAT